MTPNTSHDVSRLSAPVLDHRLEPHDVNQLELKLAYLIRPGVKRVRYLVEAFLFIPRTLGVAKSTYGASQFYGDTSAFLRFKTPTVTLERLADSGVTHTSFQSLEEALERPEPDDSAWRQGVVRNLKLLGCIYRTALRDSAPGLIGTMKVQALALGSDESPDDVHHVIEEWARRIEMALGRLRKVGEKLENEVGTQALVDTWRAVDEYTSLVSEDIVTDVVEAMDGLGMGKEDPTRAHLAELAIRAYHYRLERGYTTYVVEGDSNEELPYRRRILKRIVSSVLYLDVRHEQAGRWARDMIGMTAAAGAMLFAILVAVWAQVEWDMLSTPFIIIMVVSYMIKDRIKEWGKHYLGRRFVRYTPDKVMRIFDKHNGLRIGSCRESVRTLSPRKVEKAIVSLRHTHDSRVAEDGRPESVIHYAKEVTIYPDKLRMDPGDFEGLNDIIRFNLAHLRRRMDDPVEEYRHVHPETQEVVSTSCSRVYHVNLVLRFKSLGGDAEHERLERVRIVLDQKGIKRAEVV